MQGFTVVFVFDKNEKRLLMCLRSKDPYKGLYNLVGGRIEPGEDGLACAYRELEEETGIGRASVRLRHVMDYAYPLEPCFIKAYAGRLTGEAYLREEAHPLHWIPLEGTDFFDMGRFAGEGNIGHMLEQISKSRELLLGDAGSQAPCGIVPLDSAYRAAVDADVAEEWGGPMVVSKGRVTDTRLCPGFIALEGGVLKGYALYEIRGGECEVVALHSFDSGKGVGAALMKAAEEQARVNACSRLWLITTNDNTGAIRFYQKIGMNLRAVHLDAMEESRRLKPQIPLTGMDGIPLRHEFEFDLML